jgi:hypothetical protein
VRSSCNVLILSNLSHCKTAQDSIENMEEGLRNQPRPCLQSVLDAVGRIKLLYCAILRQDAWLDLIGKARSSFNDFRGMETTQYVADSLPALISPMAFYKLSLSEAKAAFLEHGFGDESQRA